MKTLGPDSARAPTGGVRIVLARAALFMGVLVVLLAPLELVARSRYAGRYERLPAHGAPLRPLAPDETAELADLVQPSSWPDLVYELRPSVQARFRGVPYRSNALGMRDAEVAPDKPPGVLRVAFLGDSFTFAWGVEVQQGYADLLEGLLEERLAAAGDGRRVEVLNFGVPGYNSATEVACLERKALPLQPDLVLLQYFYNDAYLPNFLMPERPRPLSYLMEWVRDAAGLRVPPGVSLEAAEGSVLADWRRDPALVPPELAYMVGTAGIERALTRLRDVTHQAGLPVAVFMISVPPPRLLADASLPVALHADDQAVFDLCARLGLPVIGTLEPMVQRLRAGGGTMHDLILSERDWHPNVEGHQVYARILVDGLERAGLVPPP